MQNSAWLGHRLETGRHVDAVAEDVAVLDNNVAQIDADTVKQATRGRHVPISPRHPLLKVDRASQRLGDALEFHQHAVAGRLDDTALALGDRRIDHLQSHGLQSSQSSLLVDFHQPAVSDDVRRKNCSETALHTLGFHRANDLLRDSELWD